MPIHNAPCGGQSPAGTKPSPSRPSQPVSGTWFQKEHPQILIQWTLSPLHRISPSGDPEYRAEVGIYQLIFDTEFPVPNRTDSTVPFSVMDPANETTPYLQGSLVLLQPYSESPHGHKPDHRNPPGAKDLQSSSKGDHGPILKVVNLQFPGFKALNVPLFPAPSIGPGTGGYSSSAGPAAGESTGD
jgi:hypothetical protein